MTHSIRTRSLAAAAVAVLALGGLAACGSDSTTSGSSSATTEKASGELAVTDVWARESATSTGNGAVYFTIENGTSTDDEITDVSVASSVAGMAQIHETVMATNTSMAGGPNNGSMGGEQMMTMQEVESVPVPAGGTVRFEPGGYHVMLMSLASPLDAGQTFEVTLTFAEAGTRTVTATVRAS